MRDEQSVAGRTQIPAAPLAILEEEELAGVGCADDIGGASLLCRAHVGDEGGLAELHGRQPSELHLLMSRIGRRTPAAVDEVASIHEVPLVADGILV